jgi:uridine kinase
MGIVIGIAGASRSGKTTLAKAIVQRLQMVDGIEGVAVVGLDSYFIKPADMAKVRVEVNNEFWYVEDDWEQPSSLNFDRFIEDIEQSKRSSPIVIAEGFLLLAEPRVRSILDYTVSGLHSTSF